MVGIYVGLGMGSDGLHLTRRTAYRQTAAELGDVVDDWAKRFDKVYGTGKAEFSGKAARAQGYLDKALPLAGTNTDLQYDITAWRARVKQGKAIWQKITPEGQTPANALVNDAGANTDARAALALKSGGDDKFRLTSNVEAQPGINIWFEVNGRNESKIGTAFTTLNDPITGTRVDDHMHLRSRSEQLAPPKAKALTSARETSSCFARPRT